MKMPLICRCEPNQAIITVLQFILDDRSRVCGVGVMFETGDLGCYDIKYLKPLTEAEYTRWLTERE